MNSPTCPACQSTKLSPVTEIGNSSPITLYFKTRQEKRSWLGNPPKEASIDRARICLDCGYTLFFCAPQHLERLQGLQNDLESRGLQS